MSRVAIVGTGVIGASWCALFNAQGHAVAAIDQRADAEVELRRAVANSNHLPSVNRRIEPSGLEPTGEHDQ
jgi:3-hydroxyacyl-CoA dehydrogenase